MTTTNEDEGLQFIRHPPTRGSYDWPVIADVLRQNPGKWTLAFRQEKYSIAVAIRNGSIRSLLREDGFKVATRNNSRSKPRMCDIYLSYDPMLDKHREERFKK
jgi:hypothetical protein